MSNGRNECVKLYLLDMQANIQTEVITQFLPASHKKNWVERKQASRRKSTEISLKIVLRNERNYHIIASKSFAWPLSHSEKQLPHNKGFIRRAKKFI